MKSFFNNNARQERASVETGNSFYVVSFLAVILIAAGCLRFYGLSKESLWLDEAVTIIRLSSTLNNALGGESTNPPLYYVLLHFWMKVFGSTEAGARSLSILPSLIAVILTYLLGNRLYNRGTGLIAASFMAISTFQISYAQEARAFTLLMGLLLASMLFMDIALKSKSKSKSMWGWFGYFVFTVASLYTHFYAVFFVIGENLFFLLCWKKSRHKITPWLTVNLAILLAFLPWMMVMLKTAGGAGQYRRYLLLKVPQALFSFLAGKTLVPLDEAAVKDIPGTLISHWHFLLMAMVSFGVVLFAAFCAIPQYRRGTYFFLSMCLGPMSLAFFISFKIMIFDERYLIGVSPVLYLFFASGLVYIITSYSRFNAPAKLVALVAVILVVTSLALGLYNYYFNPRFGKEQWREVVQYVEVHGTPGDPILFYPDFVIAPYEYYANRPDLHFVPITKSMENQEVIEWKRTLQTVGPDNRLWLVVSHAHDDEIPRRFKRIFSLKLHMQFPKAKGIDLYLFEK